MKHKKIPLVKNIVDPKASRRKKDFHMMIGIVGVMIMMIFYIWMQIKSDDTLRENLKLEADLRKLRMENQERQAEVIRLSEFGRITRIARDELGMVMLQNENIEIIQK